MISWGQLLLVIGTCVSLLISVNGQTCFNDGAIRLNNEGGFTSGSGRVEICICVSVSVNSTSCSWNTVSTGSDSVPMGWKNSLVVCRQLGYADVQSPILQSTIESSVLTSSLAQIYRALYNCDGTESTLSQCSSAITSGVLTHLADAFVSCFTGSLSQRVRTTASDSDSSGIVEYYVSGSWRTICPDSWSDTEANIVCISLGYISGTAVSFLVDTVGPNIDGSPSIASVSCTDDEEYFTACSYVLGNTCSTISLAGVSCVSAAVDDGSVRLYDVGNVNDYDRVEVYYAGRWGTVCDIVWDEQDGGVVCGELGMDVSRTLVPTSTEILNSLSSRPIWISGYNCDGTETGLSDCPSVFAVGSVSALCSHNNDAGLTCFPHDNNSGGLSGGAIAGIVIGSLVSIGIVIWFCGWQDKMKKRRLAEANGIRVRQSAAAVAQVTVEMNTTPSAQQQTHRDTPEPVTTTPPANPSFSQAPPPAYDEALHHMDVKSPPEYPDEEKKVPYPVLTNQNPAYPSAPPGPNDYQGYPPPTHPGYAPPDAVMPSPDRGTNPYPLIEGITPYPPTHGDLPYPT